MWAIDLFLFCFRMKMMITVLKNKIQNEVDSRVDLEAVGEDVTRVVFVVVLEVDAAATGVGVGVIVAIEVDAGTTIMRGVEVVEVVVVLGAVVVVEAVVEVVSKVENLGAETIEITTDQEIGETMRIMIEEVLRVVSIKESLSILQHHLKIKKLLLMINIK